MAQADDNGPDSPAGEGTLFRRAFTELLLEWIVAPLKSYSVTSFTLFAHPVSFAGEISAGKFTVKEPVRFYFISWAIGTSLGKALGVEVFNLKIGAFIDEFLVLVMISSGSIALAAFAHVPLLWSGGKGRFSHTFIAVLFVSGFLYPVIVLLEGTGQKAGITEGLLGTLVSFAIPVYWVLMLGTIHHISRFRVSTVFVLAFIILGISAALISEAIVTRGPNEYPVRARYDQEYDILNSIVFLDVESWCVEGRQPRFGLSYYLRGTIHLELGQLDLANRYLEQAINMDPENPFYLNSRGVTSFEMGNYQSAIRDFNAAIEIEPSKAGVHYNLGLAYYGLGLYKNAFESFAVAVQVEPEDGQSRELRDRLRTLRDDDMASLQAIDLMINQGLDRTPFDPSTEIKVRNLKILCK